MARHATERQVEKLSPEDRKRFQEQQAELQEQLDAIQKNETAAAGAIDQNIVRRNLAKTTAVLERDAEAEARGRQKDALAREAKALAEELRENMPTKNEMWPVRMGTPESEKCVQKQMRFEKVYGEKARRWQDIQRRLEPDNPYAGSLDNIRPDR